MRVGRGLIDQLDNMDMSRLDKMEGRARSRSLGARVIRMRKSRVTRNDGWGNINYWVNEIYKEPKGVVYTYNNDYITGE